MRRKKIIIIVCKSNLLYLIVLFFSLGFGVWLLGQPDLWSSLPISGVISGQRVVIDPGHGGSDPGAKSAFGLREKDINLDIALRLKRQLAMLGISCIMVRERDCDFGDTAGGFSTRKSKDLQYRVRLANHSQANLFLSIHANSFPQVIYRGAQTFYPVGQPESRKLAKVIQAHLVKDLGPNNRLARPGNYRVLNETKMPSVTIEVGFLSNLSEARQLADSSYRERVAVAIKNGVLAYFHGWEAAEPEESLKP